MHSLPGGDEGLEHEDTDGELEEACPLPIAPVSASVGSGADASDSAKAEAGRKKELRSAGQPEATRANEDTRTPSSCSDELQQASSVGDKDCGRDDSFAEHQGHQRQRNPLRSKAAPTKGIEESPENLVRQGLDEGTAQQMVEGSPGFPPAALVPHLSMPGLRGPRAAPAFGAASPGQDQQGPLGDLITWLDDADVGDVLDKSALTELGLHSPMSTYKHFSSANAQWGGQQVATFALIAERAAIRRPADAAMRTNSEAGEFDDADEDDFEEVPSDKEALPRAPPLAPSAAPLMRPLTPDSSPRDLQPHQRMAGYCANPSGSNVEGLMNEEEEWFARQRLTGAIGRLVRYNEAEITPKDDILGLRCTRRGRIMVTAVRENGIAAKAGVVAGDELVSIDGRKEFVGHPAHVVHASLRAPVTLVFLGFVGKLQAEVRVKRPPEPKCGLAPGTDVVFNVLDKQPRDPVKLCDAVVFQQGASPSLLITAGAGPFHQEITSNPIQQQQQSDEQNASIEGPGGKTIMYELQREDARNLVINALGTTAAL